MMSDYATAKPSLRLCCFAILALAHLGASCFHAQGYGQAADPARTRRQITRRVEPQYPPIARSARLTGNVRLQVKVAADGQVSSIQVVGGSPVFVKAVTEAVQQWRWARTSGDTVESIQIRFDKP
jgi:TonB family protein